MVDNQQRDEDPNIQAFLDWEQSESTGHVGTGGARNDITPRYIPSLDLETYLNREGVTERLLNALYPGHDGPAANYVKKQYLRPFAILLCLNHGTLIDIFIKHEQLQDDKLPFRSEPPGFPSSSKVDLWAEFRSKQWKFCPVTLRYLMGTTLDQDEILPLRIGERIGLGGTSSVYTVTVHPQYNELSPRPTGQGVTERFLSLLPGSC